MMSFNVYTVQTAPAPVAAWLQNLLGPVNSILRVDPVPLELRPLGPWGGQAHGVTTMNPDGRIQISNKMLFCSKAQLVQIYIHELAHFLLVAADKEIDHQHDAAFFCLNAVLLQRLDQAGFSCGYPTVHLNSLGLYDLQDPIPAWSDHSSSDWRPREMSWALSTAVKYLDTDLSALEIAKLISKEYCSWAEEMYLLPAKEDAKRAAAKRLELGRQAEVDQLRAANQLRGWISLILGSSLFAIVLSSWV